MDDKMKVMAARLSEIASELQGMCAEMGGEEPDSPQSYEGDEGDIADPKAGKAPAAIILALKKGMKDEEE